MSLADFLDFQLPCAEPGREDDWFIADAITPEELLEQRPRVEAQVGEPLTDAALAEELARRRRAAISACTFDCPMVARRMCLAEGLEADGARHGIRGGYTSRERRIIVRMARERDAGRIPTRKLARLFDEASADRREALNPQ